MYLFSNLSLFCCKSLIFRVLFLLTSNLVKPLKIKILRKAKKIHYYYNVSFIISLFEQYRTRCCLPYKGTNCSANHNGMIHESIIITDVVYPTKVRIFQQITTKAGKFNNGDVMLFTLQRYEFFSKSQRALVITQQRL